MSDMEIKVILEEANVNKDFFTSNRKKNNLKCPYCNKTLQPTLRQSDEYWCENYDCPRTNIEWVGSQKLWQELIRTRKALETIQEFVTKLYLNGNITDEQLERYKKMLIRALEQKE